ncbi:hypothetical protein [Corallococcus exiguus]|nr:hypothetical protein [Corallococcus exiguus]
MNPLLSAGQGTGGALLKAPALHDELKTLVTGLSKHPLLRPLS